MLKIILLISLFFSLPLFADDSVQGEGSNLDNFHYPSHTCGEKINKPKKVARFKSFEDVDEYNSAIVKYNIKVAEYNGKIKE